MQHERHFFYINLDNREVYTVIHATVY